MPIASTKLTKAAAETAASRALDSKFAAPIKAAFSRVKKAMLANARAHNGNPYKFTTAQVASGLVSLVHAVHYILPDDDYAGCNLHSVEGIRCIRTHIDGKYRAVLSVDIKGPKINIPGKHTSILVSDPEIIAEAKIIHNLLKERELLCMELSAVLKPGRTVGAIVKDYPYLAKFLRVVSVGKENLEAAFGGSK